jgi:hypothetical protein
MVPQFSYALTVRNLVHDLYLVLVGGVLHMSAKRLRRSANLPRTRLSPGTQHEQKENESFFRC